MGKTLPVMGTESQAGPAAPPPPAPTWAWHGNGAPLWAYPFGPQVLHWRISPEEFEQALGSSWRLLREGALAATTGRAGAGGLL